MNYRLYFKSTKEGRELNLFEDSRLAFKVSSSPDMCSSGDKKYTNRENTLRTLRWAVQTAKCILENNNVYASEKNPHSDILINIDDSSVFSWFQQGVAPKQYSELFCVVRRDMDFLPLPFEVLYSKFNTIK